MGNKKTIILVNMKEARKKAGYKTQEEFAKAYHISLQTVRNWEQGKTSPSLEDFIDLCEKLKCDADYLLGKIDERTHTLEYIKNNTGLTEDSVHALGFLHSRGYDTEKKTLDFLNMELSHLYRIAIEPDYENLAPIETIFSMMYFYIYGLRPSYALFKFPPVDGYQLSESAERYGVSSEQLYNEALMNEIRSHLDNMKKRQEDVKNE